MNWAKWLNTAPKEQIELVIKATKVHLKVMNSRARTTDEQALKSLIEDEDVGGTIAFRDLVDFEPELGRFEDLCLEAIKDEQYSIKKVHKEIRTPAFILKAVQNNHFVFCLLHKKEQTEEVCRLAFAAKIVDPKSNLTSQIKDKEMQAKIAKVIVEALQTGAAKFAADTDEGEKGR